MSTPTFPPALVEKVAKAVPYMHVSDKSERKRVALAVLSALADDLERVDHLVRSLQARAWRAEDEVARLREDGS